MVIHIFHRNDPEKRLNQIAATDLIWVAAVAVNKPREAITLFMSSIIYGHWTLDPTVIGIHGVRETTAGDIFLVNTRSGRRFYQVLHSNRGWKYRLRKIKVARLPTDDDPAFHGAIVALDNWLNKWMAGEAPQCTWKANFKVAQQMADNLHYLLHYRMMETTV